MTDLMRYAAELDGLVPPGARGAPVDKWQPDYKGELDLVIRRDGTWVHEGAPITRARLVRLFSTVLKREADQHFLVTPYEKYGIRVDDAPFLAVLMREELAGDQRQLVFATNVGDEVVAGPDHALAFRNGAPYLHIRGGLEARVARAVFYELAALGETRLEAGVELFGVQSDGVFFAFMPAAEMSVDPEEVVS